MITHLSETRNNTSTRQPCRYRRYLLCAPTVAATTGTRSIYRSITPAGCCSVVGPCRISPLGKATSSDATKKRLPVSASFPPFQNTSIQGCPLPFSHHAIRASDCNRLAFLFNSALLLLPLCPSYYFSCPFPVSPLHARLARRLLLSHHHHYTHNPAHEPTSILILLTYLFLRVTLFSAFTLRIIQPFGTRDLRTTFMRYAG